MKALLKNYRQAPRKVRLVADLVRGQTAAQALTTLDFLPKRAAGPVAKLIKSAVANAGASANPEALVVAGIRVDAGATLKRFRPRARGAAARIRKRTSRVQVILERKT